MCIKLEKFPYTLIIEGLIINCCCDIINGVCFVQGVDLSNIITDLVLEDKYKQILICLEKLKRAVNDKRYECVLETLQELRTELDKDIRYRVFAGKRKCYNVLLDLLKDCKKNHVIFKSTLETITSLMSGYPDLLDDDGIALQTE